MSFLLDTNIISELSKSPPNGSVLTWLGQTKEESLFISVITVAELQRGIEKLEISNRKRQLARWKSQLLARFEKRIIPIDTLIADEWGSIIALSEKRGRRLDAADGLIAATASIHQLTLVTRNITDFEVTDLPVFNPFRK